jgi:16S rRNA (guanine527-N7)-methyltransferase
MSSVSCETQDCLRAYQALLTKWQEKINLVSPTTVKDSWVRHFEDSLQLLPLVPEGAKVLYDLGSGAGFPGMVLAISRPDIAVTLIESDAKKCAFLTTVSRETGVAVTVKNVRIEAATADLAPPDLITARALASLEALFSYVRPWAEANPDLSLLFPKGENWQAEVKAARAAGWSFAMCEATSQTEKSARILLFTNLRKNPV